jgi:UDP-N-acetylglucosamine--N-acetylmuramyl-(pentapeptide) pyrophosphoryl-undecaprenol N-acetylglucosamine transferase
VSVQAAQPIRVLVAGGGTGGHLYPGLAIARALVRARPNIQPFFVGAERGIERVVLPTSGFPYELMDLHPLYRPAVWKNWRTLAGGARAWRRLDHLCEQMRPRLVIGTGGYAAGLALAYAVVHSIPMVQQAGDSHPGITARFFSRWSRQMYLAFPEAASALHAYSPDALVDTGAPIEPPPVPLPDRAAAREAWGFPREGGRVLLVYGGSQGSLAINRAVAEWIAAGLPPDVYLIWSTGRGTYAEFEHLDGAADGRVRVRENLSPVADAYAATDLAVARAGAMTTSELFAWSIPAVLIPLPTAAADHQTLNARALEAAGAGVHLPQSQLTAARLAQTVTGLLGDPARLEALAAGARARARPNAAAEIAARILALLDSPFKRVRVT